MRLGDRQQRVGLLPHDPTGRSLHFVTRLRAEVCILGVVGVGVPCAWMVTQLTMDLAHCCDATASISAKARGHFTCTS